MKDHLDWTSSLPLSRFMRQAMPALTPVITAKLRACTIGPPARAYNQSKTFPIYQGNTVFLYINETPKFSNHCYYFNYSEAFTMPIMY